MVLISETGFDYDGAVYTVVCNSQTYIKRVYRKKQVTRLVPINPNYQDIFFHIMKFQELLVQSLEFLRH